MVGSRASTDTPRLECWISELQEKNRPAPPPKPRLGGALQSSHNHKHGRGPRTGSYRKTSVKPEQLGGQGQALLQAEGPQTAHRDRVLFLCPHQRGAQVDPILTSPPTLEKRSKKEGEADEGLIWSAERGPEFWVNTGVGASRYTRTHVH